MKTISEILLEIYKINWPDMKILECGANKYGNETNLLNKVSECWYAEANPHDFKILSTVQKNVINVALSDYNGKTNFNVCHGEASGLSGILFDENHLKDLKVMNVTYNTIEVDCITYIDLLKKLNLIFNILVLDIEGYETKILENFKTIKKSFLPNIFVIECGHDWIKRLELLKDLGYKEDCYYYNNCFLTKTDYVIDKNIDIIKNINNEWRTFKWGDKIIYENFL